MDFIYIPIKNPEGIKKEINPFLSLTPPTAVISFLRANLPTDTPKDTSLPDTQPLSVCLSEVEMAPQTCAC